MLRAESQLLHAQHFTSKAVQEKPSIMVLSDIGTGKTSGVLDGLYRLWKEGEIKRILVIAPPLIARLTWPTESRAWEHFRRDDFLAICADGAPKRRLSILADEEYPIVTLSVNLTQWFCAQLPNKLKGKFDVLVIDESDKFKDAGTQRFKALRHRVGHFKRRILMTGTPSPEGLEDFWSQAFILQPGLLGHSVQAWRANNFTPVNPMADFSALRPKEGVFQTTMRMLEPFCIRIEEKDLFDMPEVLVQKHYIELPEKAKKTYKDLETNWLAEVGDGLNVAIGHAGTLQNKMLQICDGFLYGEDVGAGRPTYPMHEEKEIAVRDIFANVSGQVLVAYRYAETMRRLGIPYLGGSARTTPAEKEALVRRWNNGEIKVMGIHPASAGHGLNLQESGAHHIVYMGLPWSLSLYMQTNGRLRRMGQKNRVVVHQILAKDTIDEDVSAALGNKNVELRAVLDHMRARVGLTK